MQNNILYNLYLCIDVKELSLIKQFNASIFHEVKDFLKYVKNKAQTARGW